MNELVVKEESKLNMKKAMGMIATKQLQYSWQKENSYHTILSGRTLATANGAGIQDNQSSRGSKTCFPVERDSHSLYEHRLKQMIDKNNTYEQYMKTIIDKNNQLEAKIE